MISGNPHVWQQRKMKFSRNSFPVDQYLLLWPGNNFTLLFSVQIISEKREREREREERAQIGERERGRRDFAGDRRAVRSSDERARQSRPSSIAIASAIVRRARLSIAPLIDRAARRTIAPISPSPRNLIFSSAAWSQFDRIWWIFLLGFVSFVNECGIIHYLHVYSWGSVWKIGHVKYFL